MIDLERLRSVIEPYLFEPVNKITKSKIQHELNVQFDFDVKLKDLNQHDFTIEYINSEGGVTNQTFIIDNVVTT